MESAYWQSLLEVARTGSISAAAHSLGVTQSAVSRRLKFLEEQYDAELLERSPGGVVLTPAGRFVVERVRSILSLEEELLAGLERTKGQQAARFACTLGWAALYLPALLQRATSLDISTADIRITFGVPRQLLADAERGRFDVAIIDHPEPRLETALHQEPLPPNELWLVSSPALGLPTKLDLPAALRDHPIITRRPECCSRMLLETNLERTGRPLSEFDRVTEVNDFALQVRLVEQGGGVSLLPRPLVEDAVAAGRLVRHEVAGFEALRHRSLVSMRGLAEGSLAATLRDLVRQMFAPEDEVEAA